MKTYIIFVMAVILSVGVLLYVVSLQLFRKDESFTQIPDKDGNITLMPDETGHITLDPETEKERLQGFSKGPNTWINSFDVGYYLYMKRYGRENPLVKYTPKYTLSGEFIDTGPAPNSLPISFQTV